MLYKSMITKTIAVSCIGGKHTDDVSIGVCYTVMVVVVQVLHGGGIWNISNVVCIKCLDGNNVIGCCILVAIAMLADHAW